MVKNITLLLFSTFVSLFLIEAAYRAYLYYRVPVLFVQGLAEAIQTSAIGFTSPLYTIFNERYGFDYVPDQTFVFGQVQNGRLQACTEARTSKLGSWNKIEGSWEEAEIKVLVVGDSFSATAHDGISWTNVLQRLLSERTGRKVNVRNLGRDGQGVLQMLDIAVGELSKLRPTLLVIAYITDDISRKRIWRRLENVDGKMRLFTTTSSSPTFNPQLSVETGIIVPEPLSIEQCNQSTDRSDSIVREVEERYALATMRATASHDLFTFWHSFVLSRLLYCDAFYVHGERATKHRLSNLTDDPQTVENMRVLRDSGVPIALFHMATRSELRRGLEFTFCFGQQQLVSSLEAGVGTTSLLTKEYAPLWDDIEAIGGSPVDDHPSRRGMDFYAQTLMKGLMATGILERRP
jgi:hypothetical protein